MAEESKRTAMSGSTLQRSAHQMLLGKRTNVLLVKDDVGKSKPPTRNLPAETFVFGKQNKFDESAGDGKCPFLKKFIVTSVQLLTSTNIASRTPRQQQPENQLLKTSSVSTRSSLRKERLALRKTVP